MTKLNELSITADERGALEVLFERTGYTGEVLPSTATDERLFVYLMNMAESLMKHGETEQDEGKRILQFCRLNLYHMVQKDPTDEHFRTYLSCLRALAPYDFDSYLLFLESKRPAKERFYQPRRQILQEAVGALQEISDGKLELLSISMPPGTGKTTLGTFYLSWEMGRNPNLSNLASGHSTYMTDSIFKGVVSIITDPEYRYEEVFPGVPVVKMSAKDTTIDLYKIKRFATLTCRSLQGSLTGATRAQNILYADDLVSGIEEAMSKQRLDKLYSQYTNDLKTRKIGDRCKEIHVATRWSVHDVIGRLERQYGDGGRAKFLVLPALDENGESNFNYQYGLGYRTEDLLDLKESLDDVSFKCLYMNEPIEREGLLYDLDALNRYYDLPADEPEETLAILDPAEGGGDDTVCIVAKNYGTKDWYISGCVVSNAVPEVTDRLVTNLIAEQGVDMLRVESNGAGWRTADKIQENLENMGVKTRVLKKRTTANKETKIFVRSADVKSHFYFLDPKRYERGGMYYSMLEKLGSYSLHGKNKHDDVPDAMAMLVDFIDDTHKQQEIKIFDRFM